jgi:hypothetical protein
VLVQIEDPPMGKYLDIIRKAQQEQEARQGQNPDPDERSRTLAGQAEAKGRDLADHITEHAPNLLDEPEIRSITPAENAIVTCRRHGIALRLDADGTLVIGKADGGGKEPAPWPSLVMAIEAHAEAIAGLVAAGWRLRADVKATTA